MSVESFPLYWPVAWPRTKNRTRSQFTTNFEKSRKGLFRELDLLGAESVVLSTDIPLRNDGFPYANCRMPEDPGVAIYFLYKKKSMVFACDQYERIHENIQAVKKTIEALRGIERWGASDMLERAFQGFTALPAPDDTKEKWFNVLKINYQLLKQATPAGVKSSLKDAYLKQIKISHPDVGGTHDMILKINEAYEQGQKELNVANN